MCRSLSKSALAVFDEQKSFVGEDSFRHFIRFLVEGHSTDAPPDKSGAMSPQNSPSGACTLWVYVRQSFIDSAVAVANARAEWMTACSEYLISPSPERKISSKLSPRRGDIGIFLERIPAEAVLNSSDERNTSFLGISSVKITPSRSRREIIKGLPMLEQARRTTAVSYAPAHTVIGESGAELSVKSKDAAKESSMSRS